MLLALKLVLFFLFVHITLLVPGYVLIRQLKLFKDRSLAVCFSYLFSILLYSALALAHFIVGLPNEVIAVVFVGIFGYSIYKLISWREWPMSGSFAWLVLVLMSAASLCFVALPLAKPSGYIADPHPIAGNHYDVANVKILNLSHTPANDNSIPYRQAQFFTDQLSIKHDPFIKEWGVTFFYRTPLMGAVTSFYYDVLQQYPPRSYLWATQPGTEGRTYEQFQIIAHILNSLLILPAFLLVRRLFTKKIAQLTILFVATSPFFLYNSFFSWPKSFVAYFILCSWILLVDRKKPYLAGLASGMAYLAHDLAILYLAGSVVYLLLRKQWGYLLKMIAVLVALMAPWLLTARLAFHQVSLFFYYPFSVKDVPSDPSHVIQEFFAMPTRTIIKIKLMAVYDLIGHIQLRHWLTDQFRSYVWIDTLTTLPGAIGFFLFGFSYIAIIAHLREQWRTIVPFIFVPIVTLFVILGRPKGLGIGAMHFAEALIPLFIAYALALLMRLPKWLTAFMFATTLAGYYAMVGFSYNFDLHGWLSSPQTVAAILIAVLAQLALIYLFIVVAYDRKPKPTAVQNLLT